MSTHNSFGFNETFSVNFKHRVTEFNFVQKIQGQNPSFLQRNLSYDVTTKKLGSSFSLEVDSLEFDLKNSSSNSRMRY